ELGRAQAQVLGQVVEHLGTTVRRVLGPGGALLGGLHGVAHVLAVAERRLPYALTTCAQHRIAAVAGRPLLLATDEQLGGAVDGRQARVGAGLLGAGVQRRGPFGRSQVLGAVLRQAGGEGGLQVLVHALAAALAAEAGLAVAAEAGGGV